MNFGIIEIGSTNTKAYIYKNNELLDYGSRYIAFKNNYNLNNCLLESDINDLYDFISELKVDKIYAFGTSIFRKISEEEKDSFTKRLKQDLNVEFRVVSADEEGDYTVKGVINNIDYYSKMAVVIGGGGSTEIAIIDNKKIIEKYNLDFGAVDITNKFPDLKDDITRTSFDEILNYTMSLIGNLDYSVDVLVLAGGDYIYYYEKANYKMANNSIYQDDNQPYMLNFDVMDDYDKDMLSKSFDKIKQENSDNAKWWDFTRGMRFCMNAVARSLKVKYILPTRINMLIGLAEEIKDSFE